MRARAWQLTCVRDRGGVKVIDLVGLRTCVTGHRRSLDRVGVGGQHGAEA
jgi:hypothetical protein